MICVECEAEAEGTARGWMAFRGETEGSEPLLVFYCSRCAHDEFDDYLSELRFRRQERREGPADGSQRI
jgi:hypothetical protein